MAPYFFLSCAPEEHVERFFNDLSDTIRVRANLRGTETVGCYGLLEDANARDEGLRTSCMMIALVSPRYLRDPATERDWQTFQQRKALALENGTRAITRVSWFPCPEPLPSAVAETPVFLRPLNGNIRQLPIGVMLRAMGRYGKQYNEFVNNLADYVIESTASCCLPAIGSIPEQMPRVFVVRSEIASSPRITERSAGQNLFVIDGAFVKTLAEQIDETAGKITPLPIGDFTIQSSRDVEERYSVVVVDDDEELLELVKTTCDYSDHFDCKISKNPQEVFKVADSKWHQDQYAPDLFVIDLELAEKTTMQGLELINKLIDEVKIPSAILAMSGNLTGRRLLEVVGIRRAFRTLTKPVDLDELLAEMRDLAEIGRNRILYQNDPENFFDEGRGQRSVFLSYSSLDVETATPISNSFENKRIFAFYAPDSIREGENVPERIRTGLSRSAIFMPLISDNFASSQYCLAELANALDLQTRRKLKIIPVLLDSPTKALQDNSISKCILENKPLTMSSDNLIDGIQKILIRVQNYLSVSKKRS